MNLKNNNIRIIRATYEGSQKIRFDQALVEALRNDYSRAFCQKLIKADQVQVNGACVASVSEKIEPGSSFVVSMPIPPHPFDTPHGSITRSIPALPTPLKFCGTRTASEALPVPRNFSEGGSVFRHCGALAEQGKKNVSNGCGGNASCGVRAYPPLDVIYEHEHFAIINKPVGLLVHAAGTAPGEITLVDLLLERFKLDGFAEMLRPGIVHRLDRDTSGVMVIAKTPQGQAVFADLFHNRAISKCYHAVVQGHPPREGEMDWNIVRHPRNRLMMTHSRMIGREAFTRYAVREYYQELSLIEAFPTTGRTHQIRVHCRAMGHPIIGDAIYHEESRLIARQALHAFSLRFTYQGVPYEFHAPYPEDMQRLVESLRV